MVLWGEAFSYERGAPVVGIYAWGSHKAFPKGDVGPDFFAAFPLGPLGSSSAQHRLTPDIVL